MCPCNLSARTSILALVLACSCADAGDLQRFASSKDARQAMSTSDSLLGRTVVFHAGAEVPAPTQTTGDSCANHDSTLSVTLQIVQRLIGYKINVWALAPLILLTFITGGSIWVVAFLFPQTLVWTMQECPIHEAQYVLAKVLPPDVTPCSVSCSRSYNFLTGSC